MNTESRLSVEASPLLSDWSVSQVFSKIVVGVLLASAAAVVMLFLAGYKDYPNLHTILDTGMFLLTAILGIVLWDMGTRIGDPFPKHLAICFAIACVLNLIHVLVTVEWSGLFLPIAQAQGTLRPATWPPTTHVLPIGVGCSVWLMHRGGRRTWLLTLGLTVLSIGLLVLFTHLARYSSPWWFGITRPTLIFSPLLWAAVGIACWRQRRQDRLLPTLTLMSGVLVLANIAQLYSRAPHDTQAMVAHLGRNCGYLVWLISLMQMAAADMREKISAEQKLAQLNQVLEQRIRERTAALDATNKSLQAEMAVRQETEKANARLAAVVESSDDAIISKTLDGIITSWNSGAEKLFGYRSKEMIGQPMLTLFPTERVGEEEKILERIGRGGSVDHFETVRKRKDGAQIDVSVTISPIRDEYGTIVGASKIARDITDRKRAEMKLQMHLERLNLLHQITRAIGERQDLGSIFQVVIRTLEENLPVDFSCIGLYDHPTNTLKIVRVGVKSEPTAMELAMAEQSTVPIDENGLSWCVRGKLVYEPDISQVPFSFPQRLARGSLRSLVIAPLAVESNVFGVLIAARKQPHSFSSGECEFLHQLSEHVALASNQSQLYNALQQAYEDLRQSQQTVMQQERLRALGQMASGIAHDINNAISPVSLYTQSLLEKEPNLSERARKYLHTIKHAIDDVAETVARMREFYRQREPQLTLASVDLNRLVEQVIDLTHARWNDMPQQRGIVIQLMKELATNLPAIKGVESEIREALINLVFNSVDAMPEGGTLTLRTNVMESDQTRRAFVEVADTGIGMDEDAKRRCLEPFFTTKGERGTGLGLAMVYGMVKRHNAELDIQSEQGKGTSIRISFNTLAANATGQIQPLAPEVIPPPLRILVVDDDPLLLKSLRDTLEEDGHTVVAANGGAAGIEIFRASLASTEHFSVVITDLGMPYIDGRKVACAVKGLSPSTPIIMLTGWGQRLVDERNVPDHVDQVLNKPPTLRNLRKALACCCQPKNS